MTRGSKTHTDIPREFLIRVVPFGRGSFALRRIESKHLNFNPDDSKNPDTKNVFSLSCEVEKFPHG